MSTREVFKSDAVVLKNDLSITVTVDSSTVASDSDGRKIVKAGTLLGHASKKLWEDRSVKASVVNGPESQVIAVNSVDVTDGDKCVSALVRGAAYKNRVNSAQTIAEDINLGDRITLVGI